MTPSLQQAYIKASNTGAGDQFGTSVALSADGSTLAVGAQFEDSKATGVDGGNEADNSADDSGAVYVFTRAGATWTQQAYVKPFNTGADDQFGTSIALSADGSTLAVGAPLESSKANGVDGDPADNGATHSGAVYVFTRAGTTWTQQAYVKASNTGADDRFGISVALSGDGATLAVGAPLEDSAATGVAAGGGGAADDAASNSGATYVFTRGGATWSQHAYVKASNTDPFDQFGTSVALSADGARLVVGAPLESSAATGVGGEPNDNSATLSGAVYVFARAGATWTQQVYVKASNTGADDQFGTNLALSADGATLAVSAPLEDSAATGVGANPAAQADDSVANSGAVYVFTAGATWTLQAYIKASNTGAGDQFGTSVTLSADGSTLVVDARFEDSAGIGLGGNPADNSADDSGAVYVFTHAGAVWTQQAYVKASNTGAGDQFGTSVAVSANGSMRAVGARFEDSADTGLGGNQVDNAAADSGAVYVFP